MAEIELKLLVDEAEATAYWRRAVAAGLAEAAPKPQLLRSVYFDSEDHALKRAGIALRLRRDGRRWVQTAKAKAALSGGLSRAEEFEAPAPGGRIDLALIDSPALREEIASAGPLVPVCETSIRRAAGVLTREDGLKVELAVDCGEIIAGEARAQLREIELELIEGPLARLYDLALELSGEGVLRFSRLSKAARGYLLAAEGRIEPQPAARNAATPPLRGEMNAEAAAQAVLRECLAQIAANMEFAATAPDPEGPHQLRVGLRRFRSALSVFGSALKGPEAARLGAEARWLAGEAGRLRDLEVALDDVVGREAAANPGETGFVRLAADLLAAVEAERGRLRETLRSDRARAFLLHLARFAECRGWLLPEDIGQTARLAEPAPALAAAALEKAWRTAAKRARGLETLDVEARHELRKALKKLRYAIEFAAPLYGPKKVSAFVKRLKSLQDIFGDLNDAAMAEALFSAPGAPGEGDPAAQRAIGRVLGAAHARAEEKWRMATTLWRELESAKAFWR